MPKTNIKWQDVPTHLFEKAGRGVPVKGYVLVSRGGIDNVGVVTEDAWKARLGVQCIHGSWGWGCKKCL